MKWLALIALLCAHFARAEGQVAIQLHGRIIAAAGDVTKITIWSDGTLIARSEERGLLYALQLGDKLHYTVRFESAGQVKYCHLFTFNMQVEDIPIDVDFRSKQSIILYKRYARQGKYSLLKYGSGGAVQDLDLIPEQIR